MNFTINGEKADIILETEETVGELLSGVEEWLGAQDHCISSISVNGKELGASEMDNVFFRKLSDTAGINISTLPGDYMLLEALEITLSILGDYENSNGEERKGLREEWEKSAAAGFISRRVPELDTLIRAGLSGEGPSAGQCAGLIGERISELKDPHGELLRMQALVESIVLRLEDLPLDLQTGKDGRAAETVRIFSTSSEKLFRLMNTLKSRGIPFDQVLVNATPLLAFLKDFSAALNELAAAYEVKDVVLVGDLAEYELAPRLRSLYDAFKELPGAA